MATILAQANINIIGLVPGEKAEIEKTKLVDGLVRSGYLTLLRTPAPAKSDDPVT